MLVTEERGSAVARLGLAHALLRAGQVVEAQRRLSGLLDEGAVTGFGPADHASLLAALVDSRLSRGQLDEASALRRGLSPLTRLDGVSGAVATFATAELTAVLGDPEDAIPLYLAAGELAAGHDLSPEVAPWRVGAVLTMVRAGRRDVGRLAVEHHQEALRSGSAYAVALALRTLATADAHGRRLPLLREARAALTGVVADRLAAQIDTDIAGFLVLSHDRSGEAEAIELLRAAERYAGQQELWPLHGRVRRLLERLGQTPRPEHTEAIASLTKAELRVAGLAANGLTNRQIAEHLRVTVKAVEWHLSRVYRKLGIRSRQALEPTLGAAV
jgi:ATP/maltotriose-dependent transcriptional regulator MalT